MRRMVVRMTNATIRRKRAARKAARTRAANRAMIKRWREVDEPTNRRVEKLLNHLLRHSGNISVQWNPLSDKTRKLKHGAMYGALQSVRGGGKIWRVWIQGYKRPQDFIAAYWEPLLP